MQITKQHVHLGTLSFHTLSDPPSSAVRGGGDLPPNFFSHNPCEETAELVEALSALVADRNGGVAGRFEKGSKSNKLVRVSLCILPSDTNPNWRDREGAWSERMAIVVRSLMGLGENDEEVSLLTNLRSTARMMALEESPNRIRDPEFFPLGMASQESPDGTSVDTPFFLNSRTWEVRLNPDYLDLPKGGILAESLGSGKTVACISLIISTINRPTCLPFTVPAFDSKGEPTKSWVSTNEVRLGSELAQTGRRTSRGIRYHVSQGTLIVVPGTLVNQWADEIKKHLPDDSGVKVLCVYTKQQIPSRERRADFLEYDIVIIDRSVIKEDKDYLFSETYWKRLIFDEGNFAGVVKELDTIRLLRGDSRWLVSGMLTDNLRQGFGTTDEPSEPEYQAARSNDDDVDSNADDFELIELGDNDPPPHVDEAPELACSSYDFDDLQRLGNMIGTALGADQPGSESFSRILSSALVKRSTHHIFGVVHKIRAIMQALIVKHRQDVIETECPLPDLHMIPLLIPLDPLQMFSYNVRIATIMLHGLDFQTSDPGHLLNSKLHKDDALASLRLSTTWYAEPDMGAVTMMHEVNERKFKLDADDDAEKYQICEDLLKHLAQKDLAWSSITQISTGSVAFQLDWTVDPILQSFCDAVIKKKNHLFLDAYSLDILRNWNRQGRSEARMIELGNFTKACKRDAAKAIVETAVAEGRIYQVKDQGVKRESTGQAGKRKRAVAAKKGKASMKQKAADFAEKQAEKERQMELTTDAPGLPRPCISENKVTCRSSKLSKVLELLQGCEPDDRFVIFGMNEELGLLAEIFDLFDVTYTSVTTSKQSPTMRSNRLESFKSDSKIRALLLEPVWGATGLNLTCANKMIFLSENWTGHEINQGIKRIHRNGQKRETTVYTLIAKGTFEDKMAHPYPEHLKRNWQDRVLRDPHFCTESEEPTYRLKVPLEPQTSLPTPTIIIAPSATVITVPAIAVTKTKKRKAGIETAPESEPEGGRRSKRQSAVEAAVIPTQQLLELEKMAALKTAALDLQAGQMEGQAEEHVQVEESGGRTRRSRRED